MRTNPVINIDYITKDYEGFLQLMKDKINTILPEWTDRSNSDFGIVLLQLAAYGLHVLSFYQDKAFNEAFLSTAKTRKSVINLCRFLGYELSTLMPSAVTITFTKTTDKLNTEIVIPKGIKVSTDSAVEAPIMVFETAVATVIPAGIASADALAIQGQSIDNILIGQGNDLSNQKVVLKVPSVHINPKVVGAVSVPGLIIYTKDMSSGIIYPWIRVDNFIDSVGASYHYKAVANSDYMTDIIFGDGTSGRKVPANHQIYASYRVCNGVMGNVASGKINTLIDSIEGIESISNGNSASGGVDYESLESARTKASPSFFSAKRGVTKYDLNALALAAPSDSVGVTVGRAKTKEFFNADGDVTVYITPSDLGIASNTLKTNVKNAIEKVMVLNNKLTVESTAYVEYAVTTTVVVENLYQNDVKQDEIHDKIDALLSIDSIDIGDTVYKSRIVKEVLSVVGVLDATVTITVEGSNVDNIDMTVSTRPYEFAKLVSNTVTVTGGV